MLKYICSVYLILAEVTCEELKYIYVSPGENITLPCLSDSNRKDWSGPAHNGSSPSSVERNDINGNHVKWNITKYTDNAKINTHLPHYQRLGLSINTSNGFSNLQIKDVSTFDEGLYICDPEESSSMQQKFILQIISLPSDLHIEGTRDTNIVYGIENLEMNLTCTVVSGKPPANLTWIHETGVLIGGRHGILVYSFTPNISDHRRNFTCEAISLLSNITLSKTVQLELRYKPRVSIDFESNKTVTEGGTKQICCNSTGNPTVKNISWSQGGTLLKTNYNMSSICYIFEKIKLSDKGIYTCAAYNEIGNESINVFIHVYGLPFYVAFNNERQFGVPGHQFDIQVIVYSLSDITCKQIVDSTSGKAPSSVNNIEERSARTMVDFHGTSVTVNATKIVFHFKMLNVNDFKIYNITVCNKYGNGTFVVDLKDKNTNIYSTENKLKVPMITTVFVVISVAVGFVIVKLAWKRYKYRTQLEGSSDYTQELHVVEGQSEPIENYLYQTGYIPPPNNDPNSTVQLGDTLQDETSSDNTVTDLGTSEMNSGEAHTMSGELNYADVVFQSPATNDTQVYIRGLENRTTYAEVDLLAKVAPLPDSQSDTSSSESDFVYVDGLENYIDKMREMHDEIDMAN